MGNNNTMIDIKFDRAQPAIYYTGETISGQVHFTISEHTKAIDDIYLTITGDVGFVTIRTTRMQNGLTDRITDRHDIRIFGEKVLLSRAMSIRRSKNTMNDMMTTLAPGQYIYPFSVRLPDILPPTIHPQDYPYVRYELQLFIEKKWYSANSHHRYPLRIYPRVNLLHINNSQCTVKFNTTRKDVTIKGMLQNSSLIPGEQTNLSVDIYNPNRLGIKRIDVCLIQRYEIEQCRRRLELIRYSIPQLFDTNDQHIETSCPVTIPMGIPPSYTFKNSGGRAGVYVNIYYDIKLEVKTKGLFSDFELQIPILIGTDSIQNSNHAGTTTASATQVHSNAIDMVEFEVDNDDGVTPRS